MAERVVVVGAGIVGICCGLVLAEGGYEVLLLDRGAPGGAASRWNAGVLATSSLAPLNGPGLAARLPAMLLGRVPGFRLAPRALARAAAWGPRFVAAGRPAVHARTVAALDGLIGLSIREHERQLEGAGARGLMSDSGWMILYETEAAYAEASRLRALLKAFGVAHEALGPGGIGELEPHLAPRFACGLWLTGSRFVRDPALVLTAYLERFRGLGGSVQRAEAVAIECGPRPCAILAGGARRETDHLVVAAGPWSAALLATVRRGLPMMSERGYVRRFPLRNGAALNRPVYDVAGGLVLSPRPEGVQLSTGTELTLPGLLGLDRQREPATRRAKALLPLDSPLAGFDAEADRPTLPDSRPAIGRLEGGGSVWLCCGHQHIGFGTAAGSARLLAALLRGAAPPLDPAPFSPARFGL